MNAQDPRIDRCRGAVYQAEDTVASVMARPGRRVRIGRQVVELPEQLTFGELPAIQGFVDAVLAEPATRTRFPNRGPVHVVPRRGHRAATYHDGVIHIPAADPRGRWALTRAVVLHEVAHHLAGEPGHGASFRAALVHLHEQHVGAGAASLLQHLFEPLDALPDSLGRGPAEDPGDDQLRRVAALLAKAESTTSLQEAEAYLAKAALLAQRHSIDLAVAALGRTGARAGPTHRMVTIGPPRRALNTTLVTLYTRVARAWSVKVDIGHGSTYVLGYGLAEDLDRVESVFATASTMMVSRAQEHVRSGTWRGSSYRPADGSPARAVTAQVARNAFCIGFIERLGQRLDEAHARARSEQGSRAGTGGRADGSPSSVDLALRARELEVSDYHRRVSRARGSWRGSASAAGSAGESRRAGRRAADEFGRRGLAGGRRAIGS